MWPDRGPGVFPAVLGSCTGSLKTSGGDCFLLIEKLFLASSRSLRLNANSLVLAAAEFGGRGGRDKLEDDDFEFKTSSDVDSVTLSTLLEVAPRFSQVLVIVSKHHQSFKRSSCE